MVISVTGSRSITDYEWFEINLNKCIEEHGISKFISGGAKGIDTFIKKYCTDNNIELEEILPDWESFGRSAGIIRNKEIIEKADLNIIFWDGISKGSKFNIEYCRKNNKKYIVVLYDKNI